MHRKHSDNKVTTKLLLLKATVFSSLLKCILKHWKRGGKAAVLYCIISAGSVDRIKKQSRLHLAAGQLTPFFIILLYLLFRRCLVTYGSKNSSLWCHKGLYKSKLIPLSRAVTLPSARFYISCTTLFVPTCKKVLKGSVLTGSSIQLPEFQQESAFKKNV